MVKFQNITFFRSEHFYYCYESVVELYIRIVLATTKFLIGKSRTSFVNPVASWAKNLFKRMSFKKRAATTGKLMIPDGAPKEVELLYLNEIVSIVEKHHIPSSMIANLDQIPSKFVQSSPHTMRQKGSSNVEIVGSGDKRSTTATFVVMLVGKFLPMQLIYDVNFHVNTLSSTLF